MANKLSEPMLSVLRNLAASRPADYGLTGRSAMGGMCSTFDALHRRGLIDDDCCLTAAGVQAAKTGREVDRD